MLAAAVSLNYHRPPTLTEGPLQANFMPDTPTIGLSIAQLEGLIRSRRRVIVRLVTKREKLQKKIGAVDARITQLGGPGHDNGRRTRSRRRARNSMSLIDAIARVLSKAATPVRVGEIEAKVLASGYRSTSANFKGIVNQALIKDRRFKSAGRGIYEMKK